MISEDHWNTLRPKTNPFLDFNFLNSLIKSGSLSPKTGWLPQVIENSGGVLITFVKSHSYGEYIFDWAWAQGYERNQIPYYPKLTSMVPFTPVTTNHFLMPTFNDAAAHRLLVDHDNYFRENIFSSAHFLFLSPEEMSVFSQNDYLIRESVQYHFFNQNYLDFDSFLISLKNKKSKNIQHERRHPSLTIKRYTKEAIKPEHAKRMYQFYISTIENKNSFDYLNEAFFDLIFSSMKDNTLYVEAEKDGTPVAGSLFFYDEEKIYGRYWGSTQYIENLHFELCYYQGIEFCIEKNLKVFEAGAQGEHKIPRGFRPVRTFSAHKLKHPGFQRAISEFITQEKTQIQVAIEKLSALLPFR